MENQDNLSNNGGKALYLFMCSILGALLFVILQRALSLIYLLLLNNDYNRFSFGLTEQSLIVLNYSTLILALIFGLWYGIWLGLYWYRIVYEQGHGGLFHGFKGHWLHNEGIIAKSGIKPAINSASVASIVKSIFVTPAPHVSATPAPQAQTIKPTVRLNDEPRGAWEFDDLLKEKKLMVPKSAPAFKPALVKPALVKPALVKPSPVKSVTAKTVVAKPVAKPAATSKSVAFKSKSLASAKTVSSAKTLPVKKTVVSAKTVAKRRVVKKAVVKIS